MPDRRPPLSVVIPIYNEAASLPELHARLAETLAPEAEIIFVDDGSADRSAEILGELVAKDGRVRVVRFRRNFGKSLALAAGFRRARGELVATIDADLQEDPADISRLVEKLGDEFDVVGAWRRTRRDRRGKVLASRVFNRLVCWIGGVRFRDINCGLKVMRREVLEDFNLAGGFHRFIPLLAHWRGFRTVELEVSHAPRRHGKSRYGGQRFLRGLLDLAVILFLVRFDSRPGRYFVALGSLFGVTGFGISAYLAILRLATGSVQSRFPLLGLGLVLIVVGVQLLSLGLFGELLAYHVRTSSRSEPATWEIAPLAEETPGVLPAAVTERDDDAREVT
jgi:glycosyltransferase involved in cell wall biosynthesis